MRYYQQGGGSPNFLSQFLNFGQNPVTNTGMYMMGLNTLVNNFANKQLDKENLAYQQQQQRQYMQNSFVTNPMAFGNPNQMQTGGNVGDPEQARIQRIIELSKAWGVPSKDIFTKAKKGYQGSLENAPVEYRQYYTFGPNGSMNNTVTDYYDQLSYGTSMSPDINTVPVKNPMTRLEKNLNTVVKAMQQGGGLSRDSDYGSKKKPYPSVSKGDFAGGHRSYPIPTRADAVDALRLAGLHGRSDVKAKVYAKYPDLKKQLGGELDSVSVQRFNKPYNKLTKFEQGVVNMDLNPNYTIPEYTPSVQSSNMYDAAPGIKYTKGVAALMSNSPEPLSRGIGMAIGATGDVYTGLRHALAGDQTAANVDFLEGLATMLPFIKPFKNIGKAGKLTKAQKAYNAALATGRAASDLDNLSEAIDQYKKQMGGKIAKTKKEQAAGYYMYPNAESITFPGIGDRTFIPGPFPLVVKDQNGIQVLDKAPVRTRGQVTEYPLYKRGGSVRTNTSEVDSDDANIEAERGEYILGMGTPKDNLNPKDSNIGVGLYRIGGKRHYEGGTKLSANPGDFIFSDDKKLAFTKDQAKDLVGRSIPKTKNRTPAKLVGTYGDLNKFIATSQDPKASELDRKTALLNTENIFDKLADIAIGQEAFKGLPEGIPDFAMASIQKRERGNVQSENLEEQQENVSIPMAKYGGQMKKYQQAGSVGYTHPNYQYIAPGENYYTPKTGMRQAQIPTVYDQTFKYDGVKSSPFLQLPLPPGYAGVPTNTDPYWYMRWMQNTPQDTPVVGGVMKPNQWAENGIDDALPNFVDTYNQPTEGNQVTDGENITTVPYAPNSPVTDWSGLNTQIDSPVNVNYRGTLPVNPVTARLEGRPSVSGNWPGNQPMTTRDYNSQVNMNPAELFGLYAANRTYPSRYPTAQRFSEGENIDAILNASFRPLSAQPYLNNIQRQVNTFNSNNSGFGPQSYARNAYAFTQALNAQNQAIGQVEQANIQRQDALGNALAQNQATKGQMRLNLQDKYLRELETVKNNQEQASKNRLAQTSNLLNAYQRRAAEQRYSNAMMENFQIDPNGNLVPRQGQSLKNAIMNSTSASNTSASLNMLEQTLKLLQQYGIKNTGFVDSMIKNATGIK